MSKSICLLCASLSLSVFLSLLPQLLISVFSSPGSHSSFADPVSLSLSSLSSLCFSVSLSFCQALLSSLFPSPTLSVSVCLSLHNQPYFWLLLSGPMGWGWAAGQGGEALSSVQKMGQLKLQACSGSRTWRKQKQLQVGLAGKTKKKEERAKRMQNPKPRCILARPGGVAPCRPTWGLGYSCLPLRRCPCLMLYTCRPFLPPGGSLGACQTSQGPFPSARVPTHPFGLWRQLLPLRPVGTQGPGAGRWRHPIPHYLRPFFLCPSIPRHPGPADIRPP